jgi:hypothetical protein
VSAIRAEFYYLAEALASIGSSLPYFALEDRSICPQMSSCSWPPAQDYDNHPALHQCNEARPHVEANAEDKEEDSSR